MKDMTIAIDFDGTITTHEYPTIGEPIPFAIETIKDLIAANHQIMIWTMRSDINQSLKLAKDYLRNNLTESEFDSLWFNKNHEQSWSFSNKQHADIYIDDAAFGCPTVNFNGKRVVDWRAVRRTLLSDTNNEI